MEYLNNIKMKQKVIEEQKFDKGICLVETAHTNINDCPLKRRRKVVNKRCIGCKYLSRTKEL